MRTVPPADRVGVACQCGSRLYAYDTTSHDICCGDCGLATDRVSCPIERITELESLLAEQDAQLSQLRDDAKIVASFIVGWWPGLEDDMRWPEAADKPESDPRFRAAKRILVTLAVPASDGERTP